MNKKFSTLVASLLLASSVGAYAQLYNSITSPINTTATIAPVEAVGQLPAYNPSTKTGGYEVGKAYFLQTVGTSGSEEYLVATTQSNGSVTLESKVVANGKFANVDAANAALWVVSSINAPAGAVAPNYVFVNKATNTVLAFNNGDALTLSFTGTALTPGSLSAFDGYTWDPTLGGDQIEWLSAPSYKDPQTAPVYASVSNDYVVALAKNSRDKIVLVKIPAARVADFANLVMITPKVLENTTAFPLNPRQVNTMLGLAGKTATADSYFQLTFDPEAQMNGGENKLAVDLQAMAVKQFELTYGAEASTNNVKQGNTTDAAYYASFYPATDKTVGTDTYADLTNPANVNGFNTADRTVWFALKNRDNQYLVVDTAYIDGTGQLENPRITFAWDGLYNAKNKTRYRDPRSYLFQFLYNPQTGAVEIKSMAYLNKKASTKITGADINENPGFYQNYDDQPAKEASEWYAVSGTSTNVVSEGYVSRAALASVSEVTLNDGTAAPKGVNAFNITLGNSGHMKKRVAYA